MKTIFVNKCTYTYDYYLQLKKGMLGKSFFVTAYVIIALLLALTVFGITRGWKILLIITVLLLLYSIYKACYMPVKLAKLSVKINRKKYGKDAETTNNFFDDHIYAINEVAKTHADLKYYDVKKIHQSKDLIILEFDNSMALMIDKNGFTKGTLDEFETFIREQCPDAEVNL